MADGVARYLIDLIYIPTGEVIYHNVPIKEAATALDREPKELRNRMSVSKSKELKYGNYMVKLLSYTRTEFSKEKYMPSLDDLVAEFLRVCREPKLWATIGDDFCGEFRKAVKA